MTADLPQFSEDVAAVWAWRDARAHLEALATCLRVNDLDAMVMGLGPGRLMVTDFLGRGTGRMDAGVRHFLDAITCCPRAADGGCLWYFNGRKQPLAKVDHITDAVAAIKGYLAGGA